MSNLAALVEQFHREGYLVVPGALSAEVVLEVCSMDRSHPTGFHRRQP